MHQFIIDAFTSADVCFLFDFQLDFSFRRICMPPKIFLKQLLKKQLNQQQQKVRQVSHAKRPFCLLLEAILLAHVTIR